MSSSIERKAQTRIIELENSLVEYYENVHIRKPIDSTHVENMSITSRATKPDGFYILSVQMRTESHGLVIYKETQANGLVKFYIFDPNGRKSINSGYKLTVTYNKDLPHEISYEMTPQKTWNDDVGHCALWCIVVIILWNSYEPNHRWAALKLFEMKMRENFHVRKAFMDDIYNIVITSRSGFDTRSKTAEFVEKVLSRINALPILV